MAGIFGGAGDSDMTVRVLGDASGAASAAAQTADALASIGAAASDAASQTNAALGSIGAAGQAAFTGDQGLATTTQVATDAVQRTLGSGPSGMLSMFGSFGQGLGQAADGVMGFANNILGALNPLNLFHSSVLRLVEVMSLWRLFDKGLESVTNFVDGIWQLPIAMEKAQGSWQYMFNPAIQPGQSMASWMQQGKGIGQQISDWTMKESISLPYTRQDLIQAITSLAPAGLSSQGIEHYLPVIGDIAAAMNPNLSLQQASYSVMGAMMGYSRMLRYDLHINPEQLQQYGYNASDNASLLPALEKFAQARGLTSYNAQGQDVGAAYNISHTTFWGEWSSLIDRIQNSQIMTGDYGPFQSLKKGLEWVNNFIDTHSSDIEKFAHLLGDTLSNGMQSVANAGTALFQGLSSTGVLQDFVTAFSGLGHWLGDANTQKGIDSFLQLAGKNIGTSFQGFGQGFSSLAGGLGQAWQSMGSGGQTGLLNALTIPGMLASVLGQGAGGALSSLPYMLNLIGGGLAEPFRLGGDIATGQWGRLGPDFGSFLGSSVTNYGQFMGHALEPLGGQYDTVMNWAGHPTHGAGKRWVDSALAHTGSFFQGIPGAVGHGVTSAAGWLGGVGGDIGHGVGSAVSGIGSGIASVGGDIGSTAQQIGSTVTHGFEHALDGPKHFFDWLYNHNYYFQATVDAARQAMEQLKADFQRDWSFVTGIVSTANEHIKQAVEQAWSTIKNNAQVVWTGISTALGLVWTTIENDAKQAWSKFTSTIDQATKPIRDKIAALADGIKVGIETAVNQAEQWGENLVNNLITGLRKNLTLVSNTAKDVANELWKNLGFHSPTQEGPGASADQWAPNFIRMFNQGLLAGIPQIAATAGQMAAALGQGITNNTTHNTNVGNTTIHVHVAQMTANDVAALTGGSRYAQTLRAPGGHKQFGGIGGVLG